MCQKVPITLLFLYYNSGGIFFSTCVYTIVLKLLPLQNNKKYIIIVKIKLKYE